MQRLRPVGLRLERRRRLVRLAIGLILVATLLPGAPEIARAQSGETPGLESDPERDLERRHREFLALARSLMSDEEREIFLGLERTYQRDAFERAFWRSRDPFPETARNELTEQLDAGLMLAKERYDDLEDARAQAIILFGAPAQTFRTTCEVIRHLEIWTYSQSLLVRGGFSLVFERAGGNYRTWSPEKGLASLIQFVRATDDAEAARRIQEQCIQADRILSNLVVALDVDKLLENSPMLKRQSSEWAQAFAARSTDLPDGAETLDAELEVLFPGRRQSRTVVQAVVEIPRHQVETTASVGADQEQAVARLMVDGEVVREDELFETFRYRFDLPMNSGASSPGDPPPGEAIAGVDSLPLVLERLLRPGVYTLVLKVRDTLADRYWRNEVEIDVPRVETQPQRVVHQPDAVPDGSTDAVGTALAEANAPLAELADVADRSGGPDDLDSEPATAHSISLRVPRDRLLTGRTRVEARTTGDQIHRVAFSLDGRQLLSKGRPPYELDIDLGRTPRPRVLLAEATDADGVLLAEDEILLNSGPHRFDVRLIEPQRGRTYRRSLRAVAEVELPEQESLDRLEVFLNDTLVATLFQAPFTQPILIPDESKLTYVRVVAYLDNGASVEDVVFVNAPDLLDIVDVNLVELYTTVVNRKGAPVTDLVREDFEVIEEGRPQTIRRFERVESLPIHACILLDTSLSMIDRLDEAEEAAHHFFQSVLSDKDRGCLVTFSEQPTMQVPFTPSPEVLAGGLAGLVADGETALWDSLIFNLYYFQGLKGKRALVVLSDGEDVKSEYGFDEALEFARRSGVSIYVVGLDIHSTLMDVRHRLIRLGKETGGGSWFIDSAHELRRIYDNIESELRSQYLIAYQSDTPADEADKDRYREIEVRVKVKGLKARTARGYYP